MVEAGKDAAAVVVERVAEEVALAGEHAGGGDLGGLGGMVVALDRDVLGAEGVGGDGSGELEEEQRSQRRLLVEVGR